MGTYLIDGRTVKEELVRLAASGNKPFTISLHPGVEHILGIRIPDLRNLAKRIARSGWQDYLDCADSYYMEERILQGLVLGYIKPGEEVEAYLQRVSTFVKLINSWSVCDTFSFAGGKTFVKRHEAILWPYLKQWMRSESEYEVRFGVVMAMKYFVDDIHLQELFQCFDSIRHEGYYVKMAVAWALSVCFVYYPQPTLNYFQQNALDDFTFNKALQKIVESYRVSSEMKKQIKLMKR